MSSSDIFAVVEKNEWVFFFFRLCKLMTKDACVYFGLPFSQVLLNCILHYFILFYFLRVFFLNGILKMVHVNKIVVIIIDSAS